MTSKHFTGGSAQFAAYDDAVLNYRFDCRYMAFIDLDEFIYPKSARSVVEVIDEILSGTAASGVAINWQLFGSNGEERANYRRGVLERFTRRAPVDWVIPNKENHLPGGNAHTKTIANPRKINFWGHPHLPYYFEGFCAVNENGLNLSEFFNDPVTVEKIALNHYYCKSFEEFNIKQNRGRADINRRYTDDWFDMYDRNEVFDDGILKYRAARADNFSLESEADKLNRVIEALIKNLSAEKFDFETALTCRALSSYLKEKIPKDAEDWIVCEKVSLDAVLKSIKTLKFYSDVQLFLSELPKLLRLPYPAVKEIREASIQIISLTRETMHLNNRYKDYSELDYIIDILRSDSFDGRKNF